MTEDIAEFYGQRSFHGLYAGLIPHLDIGIAVATTRATRLDHSVAVWRLTREQFLVILGSIVAISSERRVPYDITKAITFCDETGIENRLFRLNPAVAAWIDGNDPIAPLDFVIL